MSTVTYTFDLVADKPDLKIFSQSMDMYFLICDLQNELRAKCKYEKPTEQDTYWYARIHQLMIDHEVKTEF